MVFSPTASTSYVFRCNGARICTDNVVASLLQPIQPLKECLAASAGPAQEESHNDKLRDITRRRKDWRTAKAVQTFADLGGAVTLLKTLDAPKEEDLARLTTADVIATGIAKLRSVTNKGYRAFPVIAASYGEEGHILRITKPRAEDYTWETHTDDKIRLLNLERSEHGYWFRGAAAIEQVVFAISTEGLQSWLAVRQAASTTILRPMVHPFPVAQSVPKGFQHQYPPSRIDANWACTITTKSTRGRAHVDVAFNPWYTRQFAILDDAGYWRMWNIEGIHMGPKKTTAEKSGYIYDDQALHDAAPKPDDAGWGRIIWAGDVSTLVLCNLRHVAMFAIGRETTKLKCPQVIPKGSSARILEMKRSPVWLEMFFILTDSRLFLFDTMAAGCQIVMSCPHYREAQSANLKLELYGRDDTCTALLYSSNIGLVNVYNFKLDTEAATPLTWTTDSFYLPEPKNSTKTVDIHGFCVLPATEPPARYNQRKDGRWYNPNQFYQAFTLSKNLAISQTLLAEGGLIAGPSAEKPAVYGTIAPPDDSRLVPEKIKTVKKGDESVDELVAIVPDGLPEDTIRGPRKPNFWAMKKAATQSEVLEKKSNTCDAQAWYELATAEKPYHCESEQGQCRGHASPRAEPCNGESFLEGDVVMTDYVQKIIGGVQRRKDVEQQGLSTLHDLADFSRFTEDIDDGAQVLRDFIDAFEDVDESSHVTTNLRASDISNLLELQADKAVVGALTDMSTIYDKMIELWVASLPAETPGAVRIAKERLVRNIAADLALSSLMAHVQEKPKAPDTIATNERESFRSSQFTQSQAMVSQRSHLPSATPDLDLPSSQPSIDGGMTEQYSQLLTPASSVAGSQASHSGEAAEDPSITLLRSYALHVKTQKPLRKSRADILSTWELGINIKDFVWKAPDLYGTVEEEEEDEEAIAKKKRQEHRERRRTEKFLKRQQRYSMMPSQSQGYDSPSQFDRRDKKASRKSLGAFGSQFSQFGGSQTPGFGTPIVQKSRKSMGAFPFPSQGQLGGNFGGGGSQTPQVGVSSGTPQIGVSIPRPGAGAGTSFGGGTPQIGVSVARPGAGTSFGGAASQGGAETSFGTSFGSQGGMGGMPMTQPVHGAFGGRQSLGGRRSLGGQPEKKRRKGF